VESEQLSAGMVVQGRKARSQREKSLFFPPRRLLEDHLDRGIVVQNKRKGVRQVYVTFGAGSLGRVLSSDEGLRFKDVCVMVTATVGKKSALDQVPTLKNDHLSLWGEEEKNRIAARRRSSEWGKKTWGVTEEKEVRTQRGGGKTLGMNLYRGNTTERGFADPVGDGSECVKAVHEKTETHIFHKNLNPPSRGIKRRAE